LDKLNRVQSVDDILALLKIIETVQGLDKNSPVRYKRVKKAGKLNGLFWWKALTNSEI